MELIELGCGCLVDEDGLIYAVCPNCDEELKNLERMEEWADELFIKNGGLYKIL